MTTYTGYAEPAPTVAAPSTRPNQFGILGLILAVVAAAAIVVAFRATDWYAHITFIDLKRAVGPSSSQGSDGVLYGSVGSATGVATVYFRWLGWALFLVAISAALIGNVAGPPSKVARIIGVLAGVAGVALTFLAIKVSDIGTYGSYFKHVQVGFWLAAGGFLVAAVASCIGPPRDRTA